MPPSQRLALLCTLAALAPGVAHADCRLDKLAEMPVTMAGLSPLIPASVNGVAGKFLMDTGAFYSTLSKEGAAKAKLKMHRSQVVLVEGVAGQEEIEIGTAKSFSFGGADAANVEFLVGGKHFEGSEQMGLIGQNVLGSVDVEFDLANGFVRFFKPVGCEKADLGYWAGGKAGSVPLLVSQSVRHSPILAAVEVQGRPVKALFDTGASLSFLSLEAATRLGLKMDAPGVEPFGGVRGVGRFAIRAYKVPVTSFSIGGETIRNTRLTVGDGGVGDADMLIGADFFLSHRIYVSKAQRRLYFTYNGGPVFRLDAAASTGGEVPATSSAPEGTGAEDLKRRAAASVARGDLRGAEADLSRAVALGDKSAELLTARYRLRLRLQRDADALADLDALVALAPADADARLARGALRLRREDATGAASDFEALAKAPGETAQHRISVATAWAYAGKPAEATAALDSWAAVHPGEKLKPLELNNRCHARALAGRGLDKALADCDAALAQGGRFPAALDSRALVRLRMGQAKAAAADYDLALAGAPKMAAAHQGRGVARKRLGDHGGAEADFAAAKALDPQIAETFKRIGLES